MHPIIAFILEKQYRIFILLNIILIGGLVLFISSKGSLTSKYTAYFFIAPFCLLILFNLKNPVLKVAAPIFTLIFVENIIISRIPVSNYLRVGVTLIFALTIYFSFVWRNEKRKLPKYFNTLWLLYFTFILVSMVQGNIREYNLLPANVENFVTYYLEFFLFFMIGYRAFEDPKQIKQFLLLFMVLGALSAVGHIFSILTGKNLELIRGAEMVAESRDLSEGAWRYGGFFGNVNTMSAFYVMVVPSSFYFLFNEKDFRLKIAAGLTVALMIVSLLLGASRGGLLFVVLGILISLFFIKLDIKKISTGLISAIVLLIILNQFMDQFLAEYIERAFDEMNRKGTDSPREMIWPATIDILKDHPIGIGLTTYNYSRLLNAYSNLNWANPHNMYLEMMTQTGIPGCIIFLTIVGLILTVSFKAYKKKLNYTVSSSLVFMLLMIIGFLMMGLTEPVFRNQYKLNHLFGLILGISAFLSYGILDNKIKINSDSNTTNEIK
jgi:O-antigen ligase